MVTFNWKEDDISSRTTATYLFFFYLFGWERFPITGCVNSEEEIATTIFRPKSSVKAVKFWNYATINAS